MKSASDTQPRRATSEEVRAVLSADPRVPWSPPASSESGLTFTLRSEVDIEWMRRRLDKNVPGPQPDAGAARLRLQLAGEYLRSQDLGEVGQLGDAAWLHHPKLGGVYLSLKDRAFLHFGPEQAIGFELPPAPKSRAVWSIEEGEGGVRVAAKGEPVEFDVTFSADPALGPWAARLVSFLSGDSDLEARGFPVQEIAARGPAIATETWLVDQAGARLRRIAMHRLEDIELGQIDPQAFSVPEGFRDLRRREVPRETADRVVAFRRALHRQVPAQTARAPRRADVQRRAASALAAPIMSVFVPSKRPPEIPIESCLPSTQFVPCAFEVRRLLCDNVKSAVNLIGQRLNSVTGTRDPNGLIAVTVDWLQQLEDAHNARFDTDGTFLGDGLFCLLRDPPTGTSFGGTGLLDRAAEAVAERLVEDASNLPLGGNEDPVDIPVQARLELAAITGDPGIRQNQRWDRLSLASQAAIREAVCKQRLGRLRESFAADVDNQPIPSSDEDYLWVTLRAQGVDIGFDGREVVSRLVIRDENQVEIQIRVASISATFDLERAPGMRFWVVAVGVLVVGGVIAFTAAPFLLAALVALGPLGLAPLLGLLMVPATVGPLGGFALGLLTFLMFDVASLSVSITEPTINLRVGMGVVDDEFGPEVDDMTIEGDLHVSYISDVSFVHTFVLNSLSQLASTEFEANVLDQIADNVSGRVQGAVRGQPFFVLPQRLARSIVVEIGSTELPSGESLPFEITTPILGHDLLGVSESVAVTDADSRMGAAAHSQLKVSPREAGLFTTQGDLDVEKRLTALLDDAQNPYLGYAFSQNLLNGFAQAMWIDGVLRAELITGLNEAVAALAKACPDVIKDPGICTAHAWVAASPRILLTPRAFCEERTLDGRAVQPCLRAFFDDVRLCLSCGTDGSILEIQFAFDCLAHLGLGSRDANSGRLSLFRATNTLADLYFDNRDGRFQIAPHGVQGVVGAGGVFAPLESHDCTCRVEVLNAIQDLMRRAAIAIMDTSPVRRITFFEAGENAFMNAHRYDGVLSVNMFPLRTTLYVLISPSAGLIGIAPFSGQPSTQSLDNAGCETGRALRALVSG
jgi:hypothetical protein